MKKLSDILMKSPGFSKTMEKNSGAMLTGSRMYGTPTDKSDLDLVIWVDPEEYAILEQFADSITVLEAPRKHNYPVSSMYFGRLNLIVVVEKWQYEVWVQGTNDLMQERPVSREEAVAHFSELRSRKE